MSPSSQTQFEFDDCIFVPSKRYLCKHNEYLSLTQNQTQILRVFVETAVNQPGLALKKEDIFRSIWGSQAFYDSLLTGNISTIRTVLGDSVKKPKYIETVSGFGYRFIPTVKTSLTDEAEHQAEINDVPPSESQSPEPTKEYEARIGEAKGSNSLLRWSAIALLILASISIVVGYKIWNSINATVADKTENVAENASTAQHSGSGDSTPITNPTLETGLDFKFRRERELTEQTGTVWSMDFSPDGKRFATGGSDGRIRIWETISWNSIHDLEGHSKSVNKNINSIAFSPDSQILVSGGSDKTIRVWNMQDGSLLQTISAHAGKSYGGSGVMSVNFSKDGKWLVSSGFDGSIFVWNTSDYENPSKITQQKNIIYSAIFSLDGNYIVSNSAIRGIQIWSNKEEPQLGPLNTLAEGQQFSAFVFSPNGQYMAAGNKDKEIRIWSTRDWKPLEPLNDLAEAVSKILFVTDQQIISVGYDNKVKIWNVASRSSTTIGEFENKDKITAIKASLDGTTLGIFDGKMEIWSQNKSAY